MGDRSELSMVGVTCSQAALVGLRQRCNRYQVWWALTVAAAFLTALIEPLMISFDVSSTAMLMARYH